MLRLGHRLVEIGFQDERAIDCLSPPPQISISKVEMEALRHHIVITFIMLA